MVVSLLILMGFGSCDFVTGPDTPVKGEGNLIISLGAGTERAISSGAALPGGVLASLRYELTLAGPGTAVLQRTVTGMETLSMMIALGDWHVTVKAYQGDGLAGTGSLSFTVGPGENPVRVPMYINGGYFDIAAGPSISNGTVTADFTAAFPKTTITLTVTPEAGYILKAITYNDGSDHAIAGPPYRFTMPEADVTVGAEFTLCSVGGIITTNKPGGAASGASVQLQRGGVNVGGPVSTDGSGAYTISGVPAGTGYTIEASLAGYVPGTGAPFDVTTANVTAKDLTLVKIPVAGDTTAYTGDGVTFTTAYVPGVLLFPTGTGDLGTPGTVAAAFEIGETEVTYELWYTVGLWGLTHGYFFSIPVGSSAGLLSGSPPAPGTMQEPVAFVTWFDAVVWLNALTEWVNAKAGKSLTPVYYYDSAYTKVAKNSTPASNFVTEGGHSYASAYAKPGATGFRLPASEEWELAARWRGSDPTNTVSGYADPYFTKGDSASGATASDVAATGAVAWHDGNAGGKAQAVKGKTANALGLYDMNGNVWEWCDDWGTLGSRRIIRGASWKYAYSTNRFRLGDTADDSPDVRYDDLGFRPTRTAD
jgi:formylglycine-generating enzyme required for sulfatase activity